jgi:hypothetical protein
MPRNQIQLGLTYEQWAQAQGDQKGFQVETGFANLGLDSSKMSGVRVTQVSYKPERGAVLILLEHPGYPEVAGFDEAPTFTVEDAESLYPEPVTTSTVTNEDTPGDTPAPPVTMPGMSSGPMPPPPTMGEQMPPLEERSPTAVPTEEAPTEEAPTEEAPTEEAPTEEAPTEEAPTEPTEGDTDTSGS